MTDRIGLYNNINSSSIFSIGFLLISASISLVFFNVEKVWAQTVIATIDVGNAPSPLEYNPANENMYVANRESDDVSVIYSQFNELVDTINVEGSPADLEYNPSNDYIYVANKLSVISWANIPYF